MKRPVPLSESLSHRLNLHALAASAAGVSLLALAQPSEGKIVYTATHHVIGRNEHFNLDLDHDGKKDFSILNTYRILTSSRISYLLVKPTSGIRGIEGRENSGGWRSAYALDRGARISHKHPFSALTMAWFSRSAGTCKAGFWCNATNRYLGFSFKIHGRNHYGWARLSVKTNPTLSATLTGYAYETIPNKPIVAGKTHGKDVITVQPASLGHLARGSSAIPAWRGTAH